MNTATTTMPAAFKNLPAVLEILAGALDVSLEELAALPEDAALAEMGLDSLRFIQFVVEAEDRFSIEIQDSDLLASNFETIGALCGMLQDYLEPDPLPKANPDREKSEDTEEAEDAKDGENDALTRKEIPPFEDAPPSMENAGFTDSDN